MTAATSPSLPESRSPWLEGILQELARQHIIIPDPNAVGAYLGEHRDLADFLPVVCASAQQEFDGRGELSLDVYHDPEIPDRHLTLYVRQSSYEDKIVEKIDRIWRPYEQQLAALSGFLLVTTDFRPPSNKHGI